MSARVDTVRRLNDAFNRRDLEATLSETHPDAEIDWTRSPGPMSGVYRGHAAVTDFVHDTWAVFDEFVVEPIEFVEVGSRVVMPNTVRARGRGAIPVSGNATHLYEFDAASGLISRMCLYQDRDEALADAGAV
jgi:ketosteroid isomerase-like protein